MSRYSEDAVEADIERNIRRAEENERTGRRKPLALSAPTEVRVCWCRTCGTPILAELPTGRVRTSCPRCPVGQGRVAWATYVLKSKAGTP